MLLTVAIAWVALAIPVELSREWLTVGWALQGMGVAWLSRRVKHPALPVAAALLLGTVVVRLTLNPMVLSYHLVTEPTVLSWFLYGYGLPCVCLILAARWIADRRLARFLELGAIAVAFCLLNVELSSAFAGTNGGLRLWDLGLAAQLLRSLLWGRFGLGLLALSRRTGLWWRNCGLLVLGATSLKVVALDLWALDGFARVGVLVGVALCLLVAAVMMRQRTVTA